MIYDISKATAPAMPYLGKGTECIKLLLSQTSKDMREPLVPMLFPILGAHIGDAKFQYPDLTWKETCGMMANLVGDSGCNRDRVKFCATHKSAFAYSEKPLLAEFNSAECYVPKSIITYLADGCYLTSTFLAVPSL